MSTYLSSALVIASILLVGPFGEAAQADRRSHTKRHAPDRDTAETEASDREDHEEELSEEEPHSVAHRVLWYLPNRVLDVTDVFRARVRVGPGVAISARATKAVQANLGSYMSVYAGLPGPRQKPTLRSPIGLEIYAGAGLSVLEVSVDNAFEPDYSATEIGVGTQLGIVGLDVGFDPLELVDFVTGLVGIDVVGDDF